MSGTVCLWNVSSLFVIVSMLSSIRPEVFPRFKSLSVMISLFTSKYMIFVHGAISSSNVCACHKGQNLKLGEGI